VNAPRGAHAESELVVIDHHVSPPASAAGETAGARLNPHLHELWCAPTGANVTLLLEQIIERGIAVAPVQATLFALGIYEDTGNLTYSATTHRDVQVLAWLLDPRQGANLAVITEFLNHPTTPAQRALMQLLMEQAETLSIDGHTVLIAAARMPGFTDEISTLAGRLRDFYEPDAVFVLIDLGDLVQITARSTTDELDVGAVARHLGGGGHTRAAAAHLHGVTLEEVRSRVIALAQQVSKRAVTVRSLMSAGMPLTTTPDATIAANAAQMQRFGHEGFPVVEARPDEAGGSPTLQVVGMLNRREVDRAMAHGLGEQPVRRFMRAGAVTVQPTDSVATLRRLMVESDWGQIPVVDEEGQIVGIVTRTDLIKLWDAEATRGGQREAMAQRLANRLSAGQVALLRRVGEELESLAYSGYVVGGFVRDLLLEQPAGELAPDLDIVIEGDALALARRMESRYGGRVVEHRRFGTAKWLLDRDDAPVKWAALLRGTEATTATLSLSLDFITARTEFYTEPSVLPVVQQSSIKLDLHRRDFTVNTMALCLNTSRWGELLDFWGGLADLQRRKIRVLHSLSFVDDPTRMLRGVRYEQRFDFALEPRTLELLGDALTLLDRVTPARVRNELERLLLEKQPEKGLRRLDELRILAQIDPALRFDDERAHLAVRLRERYLHAAEDDALRSEPLARLYFALLAWGLAEAEQKRLQERLALRGETMLALRSARRLHRDLPRLLQPDLPPSQATLILDAITPAIRALALVLEPSPPLAALLRRYEEAWRHVQTVLRGDDLTRLGIPRGPQTRQVLQQLRAARLDGAVSSLAEEEAMVRKLALIA
jgi:tRNA nucleotidyltransferase (CCA-adding enzyme)